MSDYPIPSSAASIWIAGDVLWLGFPPLADEHRGHSVPFPNTERGLALAMGVLRARRSGARSIGENGCPTRYQIEQELVHNKRYNEILRAMASDKAATAAEIKEAENFLSELGL